MIKIGKYAFNSKEQAIEKIEGLGIAQDEDGNNYPTHKHTIVELGLEVISEATFDEEGEVVEEAVEGKKLIRAKNTDNYHLPQAYIETIRSKYPAELIEAYLSGEFTNLTSGTVYTQYDRTRNDTSMEDDGASDIHIGIDFNI